MNISNCVEQLNAIKRSIGTELDAVELGLVVGSECIYIRSADGVVEAILQHELDTQFARFLFNEWQDAYDILAGRIDLAEAFLHGRIRSNGYLTYLFPVLAMFQQARSDDVPD